MKNDYIGDSLDAAKSVLLASLASNGISPCLVPLPSHDNFDHALFARCVSPYGPSLIYRSRENLTYRNHQRERYLNDLSIWLTTEGASTQVILFDPDTGIRPDRDTNKFLGVHRLTGFLDDHPHCVISVYQHRGTGGLSIDDSLALISTGSRFAYDFGSAAILFWANEPAQTNLERIRRMFTDSFNYRRIIPKVHNIAAAVNGEEAGRP